MDINDAMVICFKSHLKVYPHKRKIVVEQLNKNTIVYGKELYNPKKVNDAITKTYIFHAERLLLEQKKTTL